MNNSKIKIFALLIFTAFSCKKPTENIKLVVDTDIIKYTAMINVRDAHSGEAATTATIAFSGEAAPSIYELSGKKDVRLVAGMVTIGLNPNVEPTAGKPLTVTVEINAPGYNKQTTQVTFTAAQKQQVVDINITKVGSSTPPVIPAPQPIYNEVTMNFTGICPDRTDFQVRPSLYIYFRKLGSGTPFQYLGYLDKGKITTKLLQLNETYEFQIVYGGNAYKVSQKIEAANYDLTIQMPGACNF
ncbi:hypothetical protein D9M68_662400 [compost metagenome]